MSWRRKLLVVVILLAVISPMIFAPATPVRASSYVTLHEAFGPESSTVPANTQTNDTFSPNTVQLTYSSGYVTFSTCPDKACTWAIDDAATITVTHSNGTYVNHDFVSNTHDEPAEEISSLFQTGVNTVTIGLVDLMGPVRGLPRPLYLVSSVSQLPGAVLSVKSLPTDLKYTNLSSNKYSKDPVSTFTGSFVYIHADVAIAGRGPTPGFIRTYNSSNNVDGPLGVGWTHNYNMYLGSPSEGSADIVVVGPQGRADVFTHNQDDSYTSPVGVDTTLVKNGDGTYTVSQKDQTLLSFSETGLLLRITDRYGNQSSLSYDSNGRLTAIGDPAGRGNLTLTYIGSGRIITVTDWISRSVGFTYDGNNRLATETDREGKVTTYGYDGASQRLTTITDARNNVAVTNTYDGNGKVATQKDAKGLVTGQTTTFTYTVKPDSTRVTTVTYPSTSFDTNWHFATVDYYSSTGQITRTVSKPVITATEWITEEYGYDTNGFRTSYKDGRGNTTNWCFDTDYSGNAISGSLGNLTRKIDPQPTAGANRPVTLFKYDNKNNLIETITPLGVSSGTTVTCATNLSGSLNTLYATDHWFDAATQTKLISTTVSYTDPDLGQKTAITKYEYNDAANPGLISVVIVPRGNTGATPDYSYAITNTYASSGSKAGMLITVTSPLTSVVSYDYDAAGRQTKMVDANGNVTGATASDHTWEYVFDNEDRVRYAKSPAPQSGGSQLITEYRYDDVGNKIVTIDPLGQVTKYVYDERDAVKEVHQAPSVWTDPSVRPNGEITTTYLYDSLGNVTRTLRATGNSSYERATDYVYDGLNRVRKEIQYPSWTSTSTKLTTEYTYDKNGNQATLKDPLGKTTAYVWDALNRTTNIVYTSTSTANVTYTYDLNSNRSSMADGTGTTSYSYDELNRVITTTNPGSVKVAYRYDLNGNRRKLIYPDQTVVTYTFDLADRMLSVTDWANRISSYEYNVDGTPSKLTQANASTAEYVYDNAGRLTQVWNKSGNNTINRFSYLLNAVGNITRTDEVLNNGYDSCPLANCATGAISYTNDAVGRLTKEIRNLPYPQIVTTLAYQYDPVGNRLTMTQTQFGYNEVNAFTYDRADRILTSSGDLLDETYTVDANGNMTKRASNSALHVYDQVNRLIEADPDSSIYKYYYTYNGDGERTKIRRKSGFTTVNLASYVFDTNLGLSNLISDTWHPTPAQTHKYVYGLGRLYVVANNGDIGFYALDGQGSVRSITDNDSPPRVKYYEVYDAFGNEGYSNRSYDQPFRYTGEQDDQAISDAQYVFLRARYYDPVLGRFLSRDPYSGNTASPLTLNRYTYTENNPSNRTDPSGMATAKVLQSCPQGCVQGLIEAELARQKNIFDMLTTRIGPPSINVFGFVSTIIQGFPMGIGVSEQVRKHIEQMGVKNILYGGELLDTSSYGNVIWGYQMKRLGFPLGVSLWISDVISEVQYGHPDLSDDPKQVEMGYQP